MTNIDITKKLTQSRGETRSRQDLESIENKLCGQIIDAAVEVHRILRDAAFFRFNKEIPKDIEEYAV